MSAAVKIPKSKGRIGPRPDGAQEVFRRAIEEAIEVEASSFLASVLRNTRNGQLPTRGQLLRVNTELGKRGLGQVVCPIRVESVRSLERLDAEQRKAREVAAFDAMCAARPLKPPPTKFLVPIMTAAQVALKRDVKLGAYVPTHAWSQL